MYEMAYIYTLSCMHGCMPSQKSCLFAQRLEIMNLSDFINSKAKYLRRSHTI